MNNEVIIGLQAIGFVGLMAIPSFFAMCGGRAIEHLREVHLDLNNWPYSSQFWGRFVAPTLAGSIVLLANYVGDSPIQWYVFAFIGSLFIYCRLGHTKPYQRIIKALIGVSGAIFLCLQTGQWELLGMLYLSSLSAQMFLGVRNPVPAPVEEIIIYFSTYWLTPLIIMS